MWNINKIEDTYKLLELTNGYYRTPKYEAVVRARESFLMWALIIPTIFLGIWPASVLDMLATSSLWVILAV